MDIFVPITYFVSMSKKLKKSMPCPAAAFQKLISGKYKIRIIWNLKDGPQRYSEIKRGLLTGDINSEEIAARVLSRELKQLCDFGVLIRKDYNLVPPKVDYTLTSAGKEFVPLIAKMHSWGAKHLITKIEIQHGTTYSQID